MHNNIHADVKDEAFGIYVHWPFCAAKCPYCDFNSHVRNNPIDETRFLNAYLKELERNYYFAPNRTVSTVFFGGGTPSLMQGSTVAAILDKIAQLWRIDPNIEITLEANPTSIDAQNFADYAKAGVNRVSIGVQSLNDQDLRKLGRMHNAKEARGAIEIAQKNFERISFDLIYARPDQSIEHWQKELDEAIKIGTDHLSLYQLTIEEGTRFHDLYKLGKIKIPNDDHARALYDVTEEVCAKHGLYNYEISNYAKIGQESRHNQIYWRYHQYAGIGAGAHARLVSDNDHNRIALIEESNPEKWLKMVEEESHAHISEEVLSKDEQGVEYLLMCLRLREGISLKRYQHLSNQFISQKNIDRMVGHGLLLHDVDAQIIKTTKDGSRLCDYIIGQLLEN